MEVKVSLKIKPLDVPHVLNEDRALVVQPVPAVAPQRQRVEGEVWPATMAAPYIAPRLVWLSKMDADDLSRLCNDYRAELFKRAGKEDPELSRPQSAQDELGKFFNEVADLLDIEGMERTTPRVLGEVIHRLTDTDWTPRTPWEKAVVERLKHIRELLGLSELTPSKDILDRTIEYLTDRNAKASS